MDRCQPQAFLDTDDVHVPPALDAIIDALGVLLGTDIFTPAGEQVPVTPLTIVKKVTPLARTYKDRAAIPRERRDTDPQDATHAWVGSQIIAWGRFEGDEPDTRFRVLAGSQFRRATLEPSNVTYDIQLGVDETQRSLGEEGVLDFEKLVFASDYVFSHWTRASYVVSGKATYSGGYHWQQIK